MSLIGWQKLDEKFTDRRTGKKTGFHISSKTKGTTEEFVGYMFKDRDGTNKENYECIGWDLEECLALYNQGIEESKISWYSAYLFAVDRYDHWYNHFYVDNREDTLKRTCNDNFKKIMKYTMNDVINNYKEKLNIGTVNNLYRLLNNLYTYRNVHPASLWVQCSYL